MPNWSAYQFHPSFVLGFHGTEKDTVNKVVTQKRRVHLDHSKKSYDWLGHGVYFWENDPARGLEWATTGKKNGKIKHPDVVGAIIDLGLCLDLTTQIGLEEIQLAYAAYEKSMNEAKQSLAQNYKGVDRVLRELDCAVLKHYTNYAKTRGIPLTTASEPHSLKLLSFTAMQGFEQKITYNFVS